MIQPLRFHVYDGPAFTRPGDVASYPYRREPYGRAVLRHFGQVDAKVTRYSPTHLLLCWVDAPGNDSTQAWVPRSWVQPISLEESTWVDPYHLH